MEELGTHSQVRVSSFGHGRQRRHSLIAIFATAVHDNSLGDSMKNRIWLWLKSDTLSSHTHLCKASLPSTLVTVLKAGLRSELRSAYVKKILFIPSACISSVHLCRFSEADLWLFPTIIRYDACYAVLFKCSRRKISADYPNITAWMKDVYQIKVGDPSQMQVSSPPSMLSFLLLAFGCHKTLHFQSYSCFRKAYWPSYVMVHD